jgi:peptide/nickel transport system substrate-binding protein
MADEYVSGVKSVYQRFAQYKPRDGGTPDWTAGPKITHFDRVEWTVILDPATAAAALQQNEQDWWEYPALDLVDLLKANGKIKVDFTDTSGGMLYMRPNSLQPPFNNPAVRRAVMWAIDQKECMQAITPDASMYHVPMGMFTPGTPMASDVAMQPITAPRDMDKAKRMLADSGYKGETVRLMAPTDYVFLKTLGDVMADTMQRLGMTVDYVITDWGTLLQRRNNAGTLDQGGWSALISGSGGTDWLNPVFNSNLRAGGNTPGTQPGWPDIPQLEALRTQWLQAGDVATQQALCRQIQSVAIDQVPVYPLGQYFQPTAYRTDITGVPRGFATFWNVRREA